MGWGDEIMVSGIARRLQQRDPRPVRVRDRKGRIRWSDAWRGNPRFAAPDHRGPVQVLVNGPGARPYIDGWSATRWRWRDWICATGELHLDADERAFGRAHAGRVVIEPALKGGASPNKDWGAPRWRELAARLRADGHRVARFASGDEPAGVDADGTEVIRAPNFRHAAAVLAHADAAALPEGGLHHAAAALGTPSVVLFGGFISPRQTGYAHQVNFFTGGEPCGARRPCAHCRDAMARIAPRAVAATLSQLVAASREPISPGPCGPRGSGDVSADAASADRTRPAAHPRAGSAPAP